MAKSSILSSLSNFVRGWDLSFGYVAHQIPSKGRIEAVVNIEVRVCRKPHLYQHFEMEPIMLGLLDRTANKRFMVQQKGTSRRFALEKQHLKPVPSLCSLPSDSNKIC